MCVRALAVCALLSACTACDMEPKLRFYHESLAEYEELPVSGAPEYLAGGWYNHSRPTTIVTHGFTGSAEGRAMKALAGAYLRRGHNVAVLSWECGAAARGPSAGAAYIKWAVPNALQLGVEFADVLWRLSRAGLALDRTRLVGHSLGAHVFGITGHQLARSGVLLPCIIGLDPSGSGWDSRPAALRLSAGAAGTVLAVHTDPDRYGSRTRAGSLDVWPNARAAHVTQPGCAPRRSSGAMLSDKDLCNHDRSWQLVADALERPGSLVALLARNYRDWKKRGASGEDGTIDIGECDDFALSGNYYLVTRGAAPYGLGGAGLLARDNGTRTRARTADGGLTSVTFTLD